MVKFTPDAYGRNASTGFQPGSSQELTVKQFTQILSKKYENTLLVKILNQPMVPGSPMSFFQYLEGFKTRGQAIPFAAMQKMVKLIDERVQQANEPATTKQKIIEFTRELFAKFDNESLKPVVQKTNITWIPGQQIAMINLIDPSEAGKFSSSLPDDLLSCVTTVIEAKRKLDQEFGKEISNQAFNETFIDPRGNVYSALQEAALDISLGDTFDLTSLDQALTEIDPGSTSPMSVDSVGSQSSQIRLVESFQELVRQAYSIIQSEYGSEIATIAYEYAEASGDLVTHSSDVIGALKSHAETVKAAQRQLFENYDTELAEYAIASTAINPTQDLYSQYEASAEQIFADHEEKLDDLTTWMLDDPAFTVAQKEFVFYTKQLWPGYEDKGRFALFDPVKNDGPINDYDFYVTDAVWQKMLKMAASIEEIEESNQRKLESIRSKLGVDHNTMLAAALKHGIKKYASTPNFRALTAFKPAELQELERSMAEMKTA